MDRVSLGISGLDKALHGGVLPGFSLLFTGLPGTGKSLFVHRIVYNMLLNGYHVVFINTDRRPDQLMFEVKNLGMDYAKFQRSGKLILVNVHANNSLSTNGSLNVDIRDLTKLSLIIDELNCKLSSKKTFFVYDVMSEMFVWNRNPDSILQFISNASSVTANSDNISLFVINEGMQNSEYINSIKAVTNGTISFGVDNDKRWIRIDKMDSTSTRVGKRFFTINSGKGVIRFISR